MTGEQAGRVPAEEAMAKVDSLFAGLPADEQAVLVGLVDAAAAGALDAAAREWAGDDALPPFMAALRADVVPALFRAMESRSLPPTGADTGDDPGFLLDLTVSAE